MKFEMDKNLPLVSVEIEYKGNKKTFNKLDVVE